jgi:hypothetical protein
MKSRGQVIGYKSGFGFKNVIYVPTGSPGRIYVEDYLLNSERAAEKLADKCS